MKLLPFKAFLTYHVSPVFQFDAATMHHVLSVLPAGDPAPGQMARSGFTTPLPGGERLAEDLTCGRMIFTLQTAERVIPGKTLRETMDKAVRKFEDNNQRAATAKDKQMIKVEVLQRLMPQAFIVRSEVVAMFCPPYILVGTTSVKKAELMLAALRKVIGSFPCIPLSSTDIPLNEFTAWVKNPTETPAGFELGDTFTAKGRLDTTPTISGKKIDLESDETLSDYLSDSYLVTNLQLEWTDPENNMSVQFSVNETLGIKSVVWPDALIDQAQDDVGETDDDASGYLLAHAGAILLADRAGALVVALRDALGGMNEGTELWVKSEAEKPVLQTDEFTREKLLQEILKDAAESLKDWKVGDGQPGDEESEDWRDPLYEQAVNLVIEKQKGSISLVQREFRIGYNRAARMLEQMEADGIVGPLNGTGVRTVWKTEPWKLGDTNLNTDFNLI